MNGQRRARRRAFWDSVVSCCKYTEVNNYVIRGVQQKTDHFSNSYFAKNVHPALENVKLSLCITIHPSQLFEWNLAGKFVKLTMRA